MGGARKMLAIRSALFLGGWNRSGVNRWPGGRAMSRNGPSPTRKAYVSRIEFAGYRIFDLARFGLQGPRVCPARRGTMVLGDRKTLGYSGTLRGNPPVSGINQELTCQSGPAFPLNGSTRKIFWCPQMAIGGHLQWIL